MVINDTDLTFINDISTLDSLAGEIGSEVIVVIWREVYGIEKITTSSIGKWFCLFGSSVSLQRRHFSM